MPAWSIALRLLLCLLLVLNAAAPAWAGEHVHGGVAQAQNAPPCHAATSEPGSTAIAADDAGALASDAGMPADCCDGDACACACLHHAPAAGTTMPGLAAPMRSPALIGRPEAARAPPPVPVLIRPPIG